MSPKFCVGDAVRITSKARTFFGAVGFVDRTERDRVYVRFGQGCHRGYDAWAYLPGDVTRLDPVELLALLAERP